MKKKGFTLIELLAVIVILAVIALIATPLVLNTIEKAREGAAVASAYTYAEEVERYIILSELDTTLPKLQSGVEYQLSSKKFEVASVADPATTYINDLVSIKGDKPDSGYVILDSEYRIQKMEMIIKSYPVTCENDECKITGSKVEVEEEEKEENSEEIITGPTQEVATNGETYKAIVYLDPMDLTKTCNASNSVSTTGTKEGCMKWYAYKDDGTNYTMILDHNTTATIAWNSERSNTGMKEAKIELDNLVSVSNWNITPRLITADEIAEITGAKDILSWNPTTANSNSNFYLDGASGDDSKWQTKVVDTQGASNYAWLYDYTNDCTTYGCNTADLSNYGYWTSTAVAGNTATVWRIDRDGALFDNYADNATHYGVRPVITVSKDILK